MSGHNILETKAYDPTDAVFGKTPDGTTFHYPLSKGPHFLCCGQTGSGKSVFMNSMMVSLFYHATPEELQLSIIDPKKVEFAVYKGLPYCPIDPVIDMGDAFGLLSWLCWEMDERYEVLEKLRVKNIEEFNDIVRNHPEKVDELIALYEESGVKVSDEHKARAHKPMPYHVCIIDEFADLVMTAGREVEDLVVRLAQKARAAGISVIIATQRPSADIISSVIKANVPARIGLKTADATNSMIVIDEAGCEKLAGYGDAIIKLTNGDMVRLQGPYISNEEIEEIFAYLKGKYADFEVEKIDYKQICVDLELAEWAETYVTDPDDEDYTPPEKRHVKAKRKSRW